MIQRKTKLEWKVGGEWKVCGYGNHYHRQKKVFLPRFRGVLTKVKPGGVQFIILVSEGGGRFNQVSEMQTRSGLW